MRVGNRQLVALVFENQTPGRPRARSGTVTRACSAPARSLATSSRKTSSPQHSFGASAAAWACRSARIAAGTTPERRLHRLLDVLGLQKPAESTSNRRRRARTTTEPSGSSSATPPRDVLDRSPPRPRRRFPHGRAEPEPPRPPRRSTPRQLRSTATRRGSAERRPSSERAKTITGSPAALGGGSLDAGKTPHAGAGRCPSGCPRCRALRRARRPRSSRRHLGSCPLEWAKTFASFAYWNSITYGVARDHLLGDRTAPFEPSSPGDSDHRRAVHCEASCPPLWRRVRRHHATISLRPRSLATSASEMPVLPLVGSSSSWPG